MSDGVPWPLPKTWCWVTFGDVAEVRSDLKDPQATPGAVHIAPNHIEGGTGRLLGRGSVAADKVTSPKHAFHAGQILYSKIRPYLAKAVVVDFDGLCSADMYPVSVADELMDRGFLHRWLVSPAFTDAASESQGRTVLPKINQAALNTKPVPLAPLAEQRRVSAKVEALLGRASASRQRLDRIPAILARFRQTVLGAAMSGALTKEWREAKSGDEANPWSEATLASLCTAGRIITYGVIKLGAEVADGVPCLRTSDVRWLYIDVGRVKRIAPNVSAEYGRTVLRGGEVLVSVRGTLGGVAVADDSMRGWNVSREIAVVPVDATRALAKYLAYWIGADDSQRWLAGVEKGVAYTGINIEDLRTLPVSLPPLDEQAEIVRRVDRLLELADRLDVRHQAAAVRVMAVPKAILAKAFCGELVPQNPCDEPASVMLERMRTAHTATATPGVSRPNRRVTRRPKRTSMRKAKAPKKRHAP